MTIFGITCFMFTYTMSFAFNNLLRAMVSTLTFFLGTGIIGYIANTVLSLLASFDADTYGLYDSLVDVLMSLVNPV